MNDKDLNKVMNEKFVPPASSNLSARIIDAAKPPKTKQSFADRVSESFGRFLTIPKPALAIATAVILGLFTYGTMDTNTITQQPKQSSEEIITVDELWTYVTDDYGDFL